MVRTLLATLMLLGLPAAAGAVILHLGETLEVRFSLPSPPDSSQAPPGSPIHIADTLGGVINVQRIEGSGGPYMRLALLDGDDLLGAFDSSFYAPGTWFGFSDPASPYAFNAGRVSSLAALDDATIDGRILVTNLTEATWDVSLSNLVAAHGFSSNSYHVLNSAPVIASQSLLVPEPKMLALLGLGVAAIGVSRRRA